MKNRTVSRLVLLVALVGSPALFAAETAKKDPYTEAVTAYVDAAGAQLKAIRESVEASTANASDEVKQRYADVSQRLTQCDNFVRRLKTASPKEFDPLKAEFERVRGEMVKALEAARRTA